MPTLIDYKQEARELLARFGANRQSRDDGLVEVGQAVDAIIAALAREQRDGDGLDFEPDEHHSVSDMANVGYSLMQAIARLMPEYAWNETPAEVVSDLLNERDEAQQQPQQEAPGAVAFDELLQRALTDDPAFAAWREGVPDKHWIKLDLSAVRVGYELGKSTIPTRARGQ